MPRVNRGSGARVRKVRRSKDNKDRAKGKANPAPVDSSKAAAARAAVANNQQFRPNRLRVGPMVVPA